MLNVENSFAADRACDKSQLKPLKQELSALWKGS